MMLHTDPVDLHYDDWSAYCDQTDRLCKGFSLGLWAKGFLILSAQRAWLGEM